MKCIERACPFPSILPDDAEKPYCRQHWAMANPVSRYDGLRPIPTVHIPTWDELKKKPYSLKDEIDDALASIESATSKNVSAECTKPYRGTDFPFHTPELDLVEAKKIVSRIEASFANTVYPRPKRKYKKRNVVAKVPEDNISKRTGLPVRKYTKRKVDTEKIKQLVSTIAPSNELDKLLEAPFCPSLETTLPIDNTLSDLYKLAHKLNPISANPGDL